MIYVVFPPGCYGTYTTQCLYQYTDLRKEEFSGLSFGDFGSSHPIRKRGTDGIFKYVRPVHILPELDATDQVVAIVPDTTHCLDYFNNQFQKNTYKDFVDYLLKIFSLEEINNKLKSSWEYDQGIDDHIPNWIMREFISTWLTDVWQDGYNIDQWNGLSNIKFSAQDIFDDFLNTFERIVVQLGLTIVVDKSDIIKYHNIFLQKQILHNSQIKCERWVDAVLHTDNNVASPCFTLFDEAYIQHLLRSYGYEIRCYDLNEFVADANQLRKLLCKLN